MYKTICILGRQPALGLAELESLYGSTHVTAVSDHVAALDIDCTTVDFGRLGGSIKLANVLGEVTSVDIRQVEKTLISLAKSTSFVIPESGKFHLGISAIGFAVSPSKLNALGLTLKKVIKSRGVSVRTVPNQELELSSAQVYHNKLATTHGAELIIVTDGQSTIVARTVAVQDIDSYTLRDRGRPKRDARVGMLPPKLAQIIINLASGKVQEYESEAISQDSHNPKTDQRSTTSDQRSTINDQRLVLDPFCGTGVVLQEALLIGYNTYGTDLEPRMISYSRTNLEWACDRFDMGQNFELATGDATNYHWDFPTSDKTSVIIACETYLGRPFTTTPSREVLEQTASDVNLILKKFLGNIWPQLVSGTRLCLAVPAWQISPNRFRHLALVDSLTDLGYNQVEFERVSTRDLLYYREGQIVARELLVLTRK